jgi:hypothetical protein
MHSRLCTYLNSGLLVAPCEYVLHGLVPGIDWTPFWPLLAIMHLVAMPNPVFNCLWQQFKFHPNVFCYLGGFSLMYEQRYMIQSIHVYTLHLYYYSDSSSILHIFHLPGQAGCPPFPFVRYNTNLIIFYMPACLSSTHFWRNCSWKIAIFKSNKILHSIQP